ncbi:MAG TPA: preprotein translocase subunit SecE [Candidatus Edwardsbacteria bacterium]|nr:preprotein translocase subunit SecE [Candidatus Edwardsbacteria bacterium]
MFKNIWQFFQEVKVEFTKVSWPSREELWQSTLIVIIVSGIVAAFIGIVDLGLNQLVTLVLG